MWIPPRPLTSGPGFWLCGVMGPAVVIHDILVKLQRAMVATVTGSDSIPGFDQRERLQLFVWLSLLANSPSSTQWHDWDQTSRAANSTHMGFLTSCLTLLLQHLQLLTFDPLFRSCPGEWPAQVKHIRAEQTDWCHHKVPSELLVDRHLLKYETEEMFSFWSCDVTISCCSTGGHTTGGLSSLWVVECSCQSWLSVVVLGAEAAIYTSAPAVSQPLYHWFLETKIHSDQINWQQSSQSGGGALCKLKAVWGGQDRTGVMDGLRSLDPRLHNLHPQRRLGGGGWLIAPAFELW